MVCLTWPASHDLPHAVRRIRDPPHLPCLTWPVLHGLPQVAFLTWPALHSLPHLRPASHGLPRMAFLTYSASPGLPFLACLALPSLRGLPYLACLTWPALSFEPQQPSSPRPLKPVATRGSPDGRNDDCMTITAPRPLTDPPSLPAHPHPSLSLDSFPPPPPSSLECINYLHNFSVFPTNVLLIG